MLNSPENYRRRTAGAVPDTSVITAEDGLVPCLRQYADEPERK
ncbi:hypothetical protein [Streptomyces sp. bgisy060]